MSHYKKYIIAAYATTPSLHAWDQETAYFSTLAACPNIMGIEHPFLIDNNKYPIPWLLENVPTHWSIFITALPSLMQLLQQDPDCGIASQQETSRRFAVKHIQKICDYAHTLNRAFGRAIVTGVHIHSSPNNNQGAIRGNKKALQKSLVEISAMNWDNHVALHIEHCDAYLNTRDTRVHIPEKGFLSLEDEIEAIQQVGHWGIVLNWARSAIEAHNADQPLQHLHQALKANLLRGFFFSGCTNQVGNPYGVWKDSHMPPDAVTPNSLLTYQAIQNVQALLAENVYQGIKVAARPTHNSASTCANLNIKTISALQHAS